MYSSFGRSLKPPDHISILICNIEKNVGLFLFILGTQLFETGIPQRLPFLHGFFFSLLTFFSSRFNRFFEIAGKSGPNRGILSHIVGLSLIGFSPLLDKH